jgi:hypothetical protein
MSRSVYFIDRGGRRTDGLGVTTMKIVDIPLHQVSIHNDDNGQQHLYLHGHEISNIVAKVEIIIEAGKAPIIFLTLVPESLQIEVMGEVYKLPESDWQFDED